MLARTASLLTALLFVGAAQAYDPYPPRPDSDLESTQLYNRPPAELDDPGDAPSGGGSDAGALLTRIDRLERDLRRMTGQNEELQHKVQVLEEQLRAAKETPAVKEAPIREAPVLDASVRPAASTSTAAAATTTGLKRGDAFDPATAPTAPGAPKPLGSTQPSAPMGATKPVREVGQPLDIAHGRLVGDQPIAPAEIAPTPAEAAPMGPKEEYEAAVAALKSGKYESAEKSLASFLSKNGKTKFAPAATFNLGESFFLRGRHREAAEKYLEVSQKYASSSLAPESLLRLGQSLGAMGAKEQACASFSEIDAKYPAAANRVKEAAQREAKKISCN